MSENPKRNPGCNRQGPGVGSRFALPAALTVAATIAACGDAAVSPASTTVVAATPLVSLQASPGTVVQGGESNLTWTSQNASSCLASGAWTGSESLNGSQSTGALTATSTYTLTCSGTGGSAVQTATVAVTAPPSTGSATLSWSAPTQDTDGGTLTPLSGYTIYYGTSQSSLTQSVSVGDASATGYTVTGLATGTWYFSVAADAMNGTQSAMSNIESKTL